MKCTKCNGDGFTAEHDLGVNHNHYTGECISCPVQVQCDPCQGTGEVPWPIQTNTPIEDIREFMIKKDAK